MAHSLSPVAEEYEGGISSRRFPFDAPAVSSLIMGELQLSGYSQCPALYLPAYCASHSGVGARQSVLDILWDVRDFLIASCTAVAGGGGILETGWSGALIGSRGAVAAFMLDLLGLRGGEDDTRSYAVLRRRRRLLSSHRRWRMSRSPRSTCLTAAL